MDLAGGTGSRAGAGAVATISTMKWEHLFRGRGSPSPLPQGPKLRVTSRSPLPIFEGSYGTPSLFLLPPRPPACARAGDLRKCRRARLTTYSSGKQSGGRERERKRYGRGRRATAAARPRVASVRMACKHCEGIPGERGREGGKNARHVRCHDYWTLFGYSTPAGERGALVSCHCLESNPVLH